MKCKAATRLMSQKHDRPLTFREQAALQFHLTMCPACRECDRQFTLLHDTGRRLADTTASGDRESKKGKEES